MANEKYLDHGCHVCGEQHLPGTYVWTHPSLGARRAVCRTCIGRASRGEDKYFESYYSTYKETARWVCVGGINTSSAFHIWSENRSDKRRRASELRKKKSKMAHWR